MWVRKSKKHKWHLATEDNDIYGTLEAADCGATGFWLKCTPNMPALLKKEVETRCTRPTKDICKKCGSN